MTEVACKAIGVLLKALERRGESLEALAEQAGYPLAHLYNKHERIDWRAYLVLTRRAEQVFSDEDMERIGENILRSPLLAPLTLIGRLLFTAKDFYRWIYQKDLGGGRLLFNCVTPGYRDLGGSRLELSLDVSAGYEPSRFLFLASK